MRVAFESDSTLASGGSFSLLDRKLHFRPRIQVVKGAGNEHLANWGKATSWRPLRDRRMAESFDLESSE